MTQGGEMASDQGSTGTHRQRVIDNHGHIGKIGNTVVPDAYLEIAEEMRLNEREHIDLMDAVGVHAAVVHCMEDGLPLCKELLKQHPARFIGVCKQDERTSFTDEGLEQLRMYVEEWGFKALYYDPWPPEARVSQGMDPAEWGDPDPFHHLYIDRYAPIWRLCESLLIPVCFVSYRQNFETLWPGLLKIKARFPRLTIVVIHGIDPRSLVSDDGSVTIPEQAVELVRQHDDVFLDLLPGLDGMPSRYGLNDEVIRAYYDTFGPTKLMWGTEFTFVGKPTLEQYRYQFDYLAQRCPYMTKEDLGIIRGGNAVRAYRL